MNKNPDFSQDFKVFETLGGKATPIGYSFVDTGCLFLHFFFKPGIHSPHFSAAEAVSALFVLRVNPGIFFLFFSFKKLGY